MQVKKNGIKLIKDTGSLMKTTKLEKCLEENGWKKDEVICIRMKDRDYRLGERGFTNRFNYLNSGKAQIQGVLVGYAATKFGLYSHMLEIWCKNKIYQIMRKVG